MLITHLNDHKRQLTERLWDTALKKGVREVKKAIFMGAEVNATDRNGCTILFHTKSPLISKAILDNKSIKVNLNLRDKQGRSALMAHMEKGSWEIAKLFIEAGADPNIPNNQGKTPLMVAIASSHQTQKVELISQLLNAGADMDMKDKNGCTALDIAEKCENDSVITLLKAHRKIYQERHSSCDDIDMGFIPCEKQYSGRVNMTGEYIDKYLEGAEFGYLITVEEAICNGVDIDARDKNGDTALILASREGYTSIVSYLIEHGADVNAKNNFGDTVLIKSGVFSNNTEIINLLLGAGADVNTQNNNGQTALMLATKNNDKVLIQTLIAAGADLNIQDNNGQTALMLATKNNDRVLIQMLVAAGADVNMQDNNGNTALICAVDSGNSEMVNALLQIGVDANVQNKHGDTALMCAVNNGYVEIADILLQVGVNLDVKNSKMETALDIATKRGDQDSVKSINYHVKSRMESQFEREKQHLFDLNI